MAPAPMAKDLTLSTFSAWPAAMVAAEHERVGLVPEQPRFETPSVMSKETRGMPASRGRAPRASVNRERPVVNAAGVLVKPP